MTGFSEATLGFLTELKANNTRDWFNANKARYESEVREPALEFIRQMAPRLKKISGHFLAVDKKVGGSLMRPYRDTRFSKDKTPYKTNIGIQFRHERGKDVHAPGFYIHIAPSDCWAGVGLWRPEAKVARQIRDNIHERPDDWKKATKYKAFTGAWDIDPSDDEYLKRVPKEYGDEPAFPDDLRLKSFTAGHRLTQKAVTSADFDETLAKAFKQASGFMGFLTTSVGLPY